MIDEVFASYARYWAESLRIPSGRATSSMPA